METRFGRAARPGMRLLGAGWASLAVLGTLLGGVLGGCAGPESSPAVPASVSPADVDESHAARGKISDRFPNIALRTQFGDEVRFFDDLVRDRIVLVNFMYTSCTGI